MRIYDSSNSPLDFHKRCFPTEQDAIKLYGNVGDGPDGRGNCFAYDADHPPYGDLDYYCEKCRKPLDGRDD